eukprot:COSAG04_NODE_4547_length_2024_cov_2.637403_1_plen_207_part_00
MNAKVCLASLQDAASRSLLHLRLRRAPALARPRHLVTSGRRRQIRVSDRNIRQHHAAFRTLKGCRVQRAESGIQRACNCQLSQPTDTTRLRVWQQGPRVQALTSSLPCCSPIRASASVSSSSSGLSSCPKSISSLSQIAQPRMSESFAPGHPPRPLCPPPPAQSASRSLCPRPPCLARWARAAAPPSPAAQNLYTPAQFCLSTFRC